MEDRLGHDRRYAVDATKAKHELSWAPSVEFAEGLAATIAWYRDHQAWLGRIESEGGAVRRACSRPERRSSWSTTCRPAVVASSGAGLLKWQSPLSLHSRIWTTETFISRAQGRHHTLPSDRPERYPTRLAESLTQSRCLVASSTKVHVPHPPDPKHPLYDDLLAGYAPLVVL